MILHLFPAEKFTTDFVNRIFRLFNKNEHFFIIYGDQKKEYRLDEILCTDRVLFVKTLFDEKKKFVELVRGSRKIICHSLFFKMIDLYLLNNTIKDNSVTLAWAIWGKDLYEDYDRSKSIRSAVFVKPLIKETLRKSLISKTNIFITTGDYDVLKERYILRKDAKQMSAQYSYNLLEQHEYENNSDKISVMVGHSATETCRHLETFEMLKKYAGKIKVFCPLSYPKNIAYIEKVSNIGMRYFGNDYFPMTGFFKYDEYVSFLNTIDIGVFNNNRQQGMGNITNLLYLGKKVYLSKDNTIRKTYYSPNYFIYNCEDIRKDDFLDLLSPEQAKNNRERIVFKFSDENFLTEWKGIFDE